MRSNFDRSDAIQRIAVAAFPNGHPESTSLDYDIEVLRAKQEAGATFAITQLFFFVDDYLGFVEKAKPTLIPAVRESVATPSSA